MRLNEGTAQGTRFEGGLKASVAYANAQADAGQVVASELDYLEDDCYNNTGDEFINGPTEWEPGCVCEILEDGTWYCTNKAFNDWLCCSSYIPPLSK